MLCYIDLWQQLQTYSSTRFETFRSCSSPGTKSRNTIFDIYFLLQQLPEGQLTIIWVI